MKILYTFRGRLLACLLLTSCLFIGCSEEQLPLTDSITQEIPQLVPVTEDMLAIEYRVDSMFRKEAYFDPSYYGRVIIDTDYYLEHPYRRGEIVYYLSPPFIYDKNPTLEVPKQKNLTRVIALSGEKIKIVDGQIYINNQKLAAFYGRALNWGLTEMEYFNVVNTPNHGECKEECLKAAKELFHTDMAEITVPENHLFIMGDNWSRSIDSVVFGPLPTDHIYGKMIGIEGKAPVKKQSWDEFKKANNNK